MFTSDPVMIEMMRHLKYQGQTSTEVRRLSARLRSTIQRESDKAMMDKDEPRTWYRFSVLWAVLLLANIALDHGGVLSSWLYRGSTASLILVYLQRAQEAQHGASLWRTWGLRLTLGGTVILGLLWLLSSIALYRR